MNLLLFTTSLPRGRGWENSSLLAARKQWAVDFLLCTAAPALGSGERNSFCALAIALGQRAGEVLLHTTSLLAMLHCLVAAGSGNNFYARLNCLGVEHNTTLLISA